MSKKYKLEDVILFASQYNFEVLDTEYVDVKTNMKFKCVKCGSITKRSFDTFKKTQCCSVCKKNELHQKWDNILYNVLEICRKYNKIIPLKQLRFENVTVSTDTIIDIIHAKGYSSYADFCNKNGVFNPENIIINNKRVPKSEITIEDLIALWKECKEKYDVNLGSEICNKYTKEWNIPSWSVIQEILRKNNLTLDEFYSHVGINYNRKDVSKYDFYLQQFIQISNELGKHITVSELKNNKWNLPSSRWFVTNCPNKNVKNYNEFLEWIGLIPKYNLSKSKAIEVILRMQSRLERPLMYDDFRCPKKDEIGIGAINKIWGSLNKMKRELNLEINQEDMMHKKRTYEEAKADILDCCNKVNTSENRRIITTKDIKKHCPVNALSYTKVFKENNQTLREYITSIGFEFQKEGNGLNYIFEDGEKVRSQHELDFSNIIRNKLNLQYNVDYFRDVRYREFIKTYDGLIDCDYIIKHKGRIVYVEIAGMLKDYVKNFISKTPIINSKSKEKYRTKLTQKEQMLKENNLEYYILFPSEIQEDFILEIFNK